MVNSESVAQNNLLDKVLRFYTDNNIDVLQVQLQDVEINIKKEQTSDLSTGLVQHTHTALEENAQEVRNGVDIVTINSPMVGVFYNSPNPGSSAYVKEGDYIESGMVVGLIEAMKTFNEIRTEVSGIVKEIPVVDGQMVEHGQVLLKIIPQ